MERCPIHSVEYRIYSGKKHCLKCSAERVKRRRHKNKELLVKYKGGRCVICGYSKCLDAMDFHHVYGKSFTISLNTRVVAIKRLIREVDKCILVCSNCHREIHRGMHKYLNGYLSVKNMEVLSEINRVKKEYYCIDCGKKIVSYRATRCTTCAFIKRRKVIRPRINVLLKELEGSSYCAVGRKYGVSDNAIRKWIKNARVVK
jgi:DNA-directed RNA polymerase subunit RPC12/RpoP